MGKLKQDDMAKKLKAASDDSVLDALRNLISTGNALDAKFPSEFSEEEMASPEYAAYYEAWRVAEAIVSVKRIEEG